MNRYDLLESVSQGKDGAMPEENYLLAQVANDIRRATEGCGDDEKKSLPCSQYAMILNEKEKRAAERWSKGLKRVESGLNLTICSLLEFQDQAEVNLIHIFQRMASSTRPIT